MNETTHASLFRSRYLAVILSAACLLGLFGVVLLGVSIWWPTVDPSGQPATANLSTTTRTMTCPLLQAQTKTLAFRSQGEVVSELKAFLNSRGERLTNSKYYNMATRAAVMRFQCEVMGICNAQGVNRNIYGNVEATTRNAILTLCTSPNQISLTSSTTKEENGSTSPQATSLSGDTPSTYTYPTKASTTSLTLYPNFVNACTRRVVDYVNNQNVLGAPIGWCSDPNKSLIFSVTHESDFNTHFVYDANWNKIFDANYRGDSANYMNDYRPEDIGSIFRYNISPLGTTTKESFLGMALDTFFNKDTINITGRPHRNGFMFMGINDVALLPSTGAEDVWVRFSFRIRGNNLGESGGIHPSGQRVVLGTLFLWPEANRLNTRHFYEFNLYKNPANFHANQHGRPCQPDGRVYDHCFYDPSVEGRFAEGKYVAIETVPGHEALAHPVLNQWYTVQIPLTRMLREAAWQFPPSSWDLARLTGLYIGIESKGASRVWLEIKDYNAERVQ